MYALERPGPKNLETYIQITRDHLGEAGAAFVIDDHRLWVRSQSMDRIHCLAGAVFESKVGAILLVSS